ncbi:hypothetical protein HDU81_007107, partial [Chytriomyces hyalinus]
MQTFDGMMGRIESSSSGSSAVSFPAAPPSTSWLDGLATAFDNTQPIETPSSPIAAAPPRQRRSRLPTQPKQLRNLKDLPLERLPTLRRTFSFKKLRFTAEAGDAFDHAETVANDAEDVVESVAESVQEMLQDCEIPSYKPEDALTLSDAAQVPTMDEPKKDDSASLQALNAAFMAFLHSDAMKRDLRQACSNNSNSIYYTAEQTRQMQYQLSIGKLRNSKRPLHQQVLIVGVLAKL